MKALVIIALCLSFVAITRFMNFVFDNVAIKSVGAKANRKSSKIAKVNINDSEDIKRAVEYYKSMID